MIGMTISHYRILEKLGEGGMGVVYKAEDTDLHRNVALKFLAPQALVSEEEKARFVREARSAAALSHSSICHIYEIDEFEGQNFIAMEYVGGEDLKTRIESGPLKLEEALRLAIQIAEGLQKANEEGVVHRDIKPANVMVTPEGQAKIMDFGLAKSAGQSVLTKTGSTLGTVAYMSPEQARGELVDGRTDIWSLGVMLYELISGQRPFRGDYEPAVVYSILNEIPEPLTALRTGVPMELERIVSKAMAKRLDERYQHAIELLADLRRMFRECESAGSGTAQSVRKWPAGRRGYWYVGAAAAATLLAVIGYNVLSNRLSTDSSDSIDSIAVLPLENISGDPEEDYFVEGMHEALITDLSKIGAWRVISRTSVMRYKGSDKSMSEIARELGVEALVEGSVLRVGDQVRITTQLIDGLTDEHLWAESYDRDLRNVLTLINEVARAITGEIEVALTQPEEDLAGTRPVIPEAYDAYLRGLHSLSRFPINVDKALEYFQEAVDIDPSFAPAWAGMSESNLALGRIGLESAEENIPRSKEFALKAIELDGMLSAAHSSLGRARLYSWDWPGAEKAFRRALELNPSDAGAHLGYGEYLTVIGSLEEGLRHIKRGRDCDPFSILANFPVAHHLYMLRRYDEAIQESHRIMDRLAATPVYYVIGRSLWQKGMYEEAIEAYKKAEFGTSPSGEDIDLNQALESGYADSGARGAWLAVADVLMARSKLSYVDPTTLAAVYALAGEIDSAFEWLERAYEQRYPLLWHITVAADFDILRSDPRYQDLVTRMKIPEAAG